MTIKLEEFVSMLNEGNKTTFDVNGKVTRPTVSEALTTKDANILVPQAITQIIEEEGDNLPLVSDLFQVINLKEGRAMEFINSGAIRAFEIAEGQEYPVQALNFSAQGTGVKDVRVKKYGLRVPITDEMVSDSQWDVIGLHLRAAGRALKRKREEVTFHEFNENGHVVFDGNLYQPGQDGYPTGRGFDGELNGTLTAQDMFDMSASIMSAGYIPTDVIMHPLCWSLFSANEMVATAGAAAFGGAKEGRDPRQFSTQNAMGLNVIFSPYVPFDQVNRTFDFYIIDRNNIGVILRKEDISTEQFDDPIRDITTLKIKERYGVGVLNGGEAIAVARNVAFAKTFDMPAREFEKLELPTDLKNESGTKGKHPQDKI